jgi:hypothetical protein
LVRGDELGILKCDLLREAERGEEEEKAGKIRKCRVAVGSGTWLDQIVEVDEDE